MVKVFVAMGENMLMNQGSRMDTEHAQHVSFIISIIGSCITGASFVWHWLAINHDAITSACALGGFMIAVIGALINGYYRWFK
jgi:uncharacterized membrane protein YeaQ/YmgE (transglycosylase-associated protein family)